MEQRAGFQQILVIEAVEHRSRTDLFKVQLKDGLEFIVSSVYMPLEYQGLFLFTRGGASPGHIMDDIEDMENRADEAAEVFSHAQLCLAAENTALRLIARAEQCSAGLIRKLEQKKYGAAAAEAVVLRLREQNLVNDGRYARLWLKAKAGRGHKSPRYLINALRVRGIGREAAEEALQEQLSVKEAEAELLRRFVKKHRKIPLPVLRGFLKNEGFSSDVIAEYFEEIQN
jgi:regulatory protein